MKIALVLDWGAYYYLDLRFTDPRNLPGFYEARAIEERMTRRWCLTSGSVPRTPYSVI